MSVKTIREDYYKNGYTQTCKEPKHKCQLRAAIQTSVGMVRNLKTGYNITTAISLAVGSCGCDPTLMFEVFTLMMNCLVGRVKMEAEVERSFKQ